MPRILSPSSLPVIIVVPCYNEALRFPVAAFRDHLQQNSLHRFLLVNDGSRDQTTQVLTRLVAEFPDRLRLVDNQENRGKAEAVRQGMQMALAELEQAGGGIAGFWDADLATPLNAIADLARIFDERPEVVMVFGARVQLLGRQIVRKPIRHYLGRCFATVVSTMMRLPIYDTQCGAKLFRYTSWTPRLFEENFLSRWVFDVEILARYLTMQNGPAAPREKGIYEYPLMKWEDVDGSKVKPTDFLKALQQLWGIYQRYRLWERQ